MRKAVAYLLLLFAIPTLVLAEDIGWPREMTQNGARIVYYQPQIDQWQLSRVVVCDPMSGDDYRQAQRIEAMRKDSEQSLLAQAQSPSGPHKIHADLDCLGIHRPRP